MDTQEEHSLKNSVQNPTLTFSWNATRNPKARAFKVKNKTNKQNISNIFMNTSATVDEHLENLSASSPKKNANTDFRKPNFKRQRTQNEESESVGNEYVSIHNTEKPHFDNSANPQQKYNKNYSLFDNKRKVTYVDSTSGYSVSEKLFASKGQKFSEMTQIHKHILSNLEKNKFVKLTTVQAKAMPVIFSGKNTLVRSQTGSGKTLAYAIPIINALQNILPRLKRENGIQAIVVVPTRELALQTHEHFNKINTFQWIVTGHLCGGENRKTEKVRLRKGVHVLIGTPGRLLDHVLHTSAVNLQGVRCLVLDEADRLLDMGFRKTIISLVEEIDKAKLNFEYDPLALLKNRGNNNEQSIGDNSDDSESTEEMSLSKVESKQRQTILLSATLTKAVTELAEFAMKDHVYVDALEDASLAPTNSLIIPSTVKQQFILTYVKHRLFTLSAIIVEMNKKNSKAFVFMASSQMVEFHHDLFTNYLLKMPKNRGKLKTGDVVLLDEHPEMDYDDESNEDEIVLDIPIFKLHGSMDQKQRKEVFTGFRAAKKGVLLCTDVAARGLDVPEADCIIQYTGPQTDEDYLHRVGRTGRAGKSGSAIIFLTHEEQEYVTRLQEHKVFLKKRNPSEIVKNLWDLMEEPDEERAATALQRRYENAVSSNKDLHRSACFAYSSWSRFYNSYPSSMRTIFDFKKVNLGHYVTSFALRDTPSMVAKVVRGEVKSIEIPRLNKKLANHTTDVADIGALKRKAQKSVSLITSEYSSGLQPAKKKKKKKQ